MVPPPPPPPILEPGSSMASLNVPHPANATANAERHTIKIADNFFIFIIDCYLVPSPARGVPHAGAGIYFILTNRLFMSFHLSLRMIISTTNSDTAAIRKGIVRLTV